MASVISAGTTSSTSLNLTADTSGVLQLASNNGTVAMTIDTSQNVSFTNQPTFTGGTANGVAYLNGSKVVTTGSALTFDGSVFQTSGIVRASSGANQGFEAGWSSGASYVYVQAYDRTASTFQPLALTASNIQFLAGSSPSEQMRLTSTGLGIGTSSPAYLLQVSKSQNGETSASVTNANTGASAYGLYRLDNSVAGGGAGFALFSSGYTASGVLRPSGAYVYSQPNASGGLTLNTEGAYPIYFGTNNTERARIDTSGNWLYGGNITTAEAVNGLTLVRSGANTPYFVSNTSQANRIHYYFQYNGTTVGNISTTTTATSYGTSSDYRLKNSVAPMTGALAKVSALKPVTYKWNVDGSDGEGFIAHELQAVVPQCVAGEKDAVETYTDAEGNEQTRPVYQSVDTSFLVATLTAAIKEQQALIETLTTRITALEAK